MDCPKCDAVDHGFDMSDVRAEFWSDDTHITIVIDRLWDARCPYCGGGDFRCEWLVKEDGVTVASFREESKAWSYVDVQYDGIEQYVEEDDGESWLRRCEGWG